MEKKEYEEYLKSEHWKNIKQRFYTKIKEKRCYICKEKHKLNIHHKTYEHLWKEHFNDLLLLCENCHIYLHQFVRENKNNKKEKINLWNAADKIKKKLYPSAELHWSKKKKRKKKGKKRKQFISKKDVKEQKIKMSFGIRILKLERISKEKLEEKKRTSDQKKITNYLKRSQRKPKR